MHGRIPIGGVLIVCLLLAFSPAGIARGDTADVPVYRGDLARTGVMPGPGPDPAHGVRVKWSVAGSDESPAVVDGIVYTGNCALESESGIALRCFPGGGTTAPSVVDGTVYLGVFAALDGGPWSGIAAFDAATGERLWQFKTEDLVGSSPAVVDGVVYAASFDGSVYALAAATGAERWRFVTNNGKRGAGAFIGSSPAVVGGVVYIGGDDHNVYALDAATGSELWRFVTGELINSTPAVVDGVVYIGSSDGNVYALDAATGVERWRFNTGGWVWSSPAVVGGSVYIGSMPSWENRKTGTGYLHALDAATGAERWRFAAGREVTSSPVVADGVVYFGSLVVSESGVNEGTLYALDAETGTELWRFAMLEPIESSPVVVGGVVYVAVSGSEPGLFALESSDGPPLSVGAAAEVARDGVLLHGGPSDSTVVRATLAEGTLVAVTGEQVVTSGVSWWPVTVDETGMPGWLQATDLRMVSTS